MKLDKKEHRELLMTVIESVNFSGKDVELAAEIKASIRAAGVEGEKTQAPTGELEVLRKARNTKNTAKAAPINGT